MAIASARCCTAQRLWSGHKVLSIALLRLSNPSMAMESSVVTRHLSFVTNSSPCCLCLATHTTLYATTLPGMVSGKAWPRDTLPSASSLSISSAAGAALSWKPL